MLGDVLPWGSIGKRLHPTQKPLAPIASLIEAYSAPGEVVLDPFMGVGTVPVACTMTKRRFVGIEIDAEHFEAARNRLGRKRKGSP